MNLTRLATLATMLPLGLSEPIFAQSMDTAGGDSECTGCPFPSARAPFKISIDATGSSNPADTHAGVYVQIVNGNWNICSTRPGLFFFWVPQWELYIPAYEFTSAACEPFAFSCTEHFYVKNSPGTVNHEFTDAFELLGAGTGEHASQFATYKRFIGSASPGFANLRARLDSGNFSTYTMKHDPPGVVQYMVRSQELPDYYPIAEPLPSDPPASEFRAIYTHSAPSVPGIADDYLAWSGPNTLPDGDLGLNLWWICCPNIMFVLFEVVVN